MLKHLRWLLLAALVVTALGAASVARTAVGTDTSELRDAVTVGGVMTHQNALQAIADANGGTRAAGTPGYDASVEYVAELLEGAGYDVTIQEFTYDRFIQNSPSEFSRLSPDPEVYIDGFDQDFVAMSYSGSGNIPSAQLVAVGGIVIPSPGGSTSGCAASDFAGFPAGAVALIQRGTCTFRQKADNADAAGAAGVVIFNEGNVDPTDDRLGVVNGTLDPPIADIPVIGTSFAIGEELYNLTQSRPPVLVHLKVDASVVSTPASNVIADSESGRTDRTVVVGGSPRLGARRPGNQRQRIGLVDDPRGRAADGRARHRPTNRVRFTFWGAEEDGLIGSQHYVDSLSKSELKDIMLYLNFDMVGSPNFVRFVYDGDGSAFGTDGPNGSGSIEGVFSEYFSSLGLASEPTEFDGRSDYDAFINAGIPAGGLFTGAEGIKTAAQAAIYGGTAGQPYDPCYHQACDTIDNLSETALDQMSDAVAHATLLYAMTRSSVNGTDKASNKAKENMEFRGSLLKK